MVVVLLTAEGRPLVSNRSFESHRPFESFDAFVAARLPALLRYARVLTRGGSDAEDLVQEALVRTGVAWSRVRRQDDPEGYVRQTMLRLVMNEGRRRVREVTVERLPDPGSMEAGYDRVDETVDIGSLFDGLPGRMRAVLVMRYLDGKGDDEIARALGCSRGTVRSQASRALAKLRREPSTGTTESSGESTRPTPSVWTWSGRRDDGRD